MVIREQIRERVVEATKGSAACDLAALCGVSAETIRRWRNGTGWPTAEAIACIALRFGLSVDWLLLAEGPALQSNCLAANLTKATVAELLQTLALKLETESQSPTTRNMQELVAQTRTMRITSTAPLAQRSLSHSA